MELCPSLRGVCMCVCVSVTKFREHVFSFSDSCLLHVNSLYVVRNVPSSTSLIGRCHRARSRNSES